MKNILLCAALFFASLVFTSCKKDEANTSEEAQVSVYLHDDPAEGYQKIKVHLKGVSVYSQTAGEWVSLTYNNNIYDLLTLDSSNPVFLGQTKLKGGNIDSLRIFIGSDNSVQVSGISHPMILDSTDLDKLKVKMDDHLNGGTNYKLTIDFKASESIDDSGGVYKLKASLKVTVKSI